RVLVRGQRSAFGAGQVEVVERQRYRPQVVFDQQRFEKPAERGLARTLCAADPDDDLALVEPQVGDGVRDRAPVPVDHLAVVLGQTFGGDQVGDRRAHAILSGRGSPLAKASTLASAFIPIAMRVSALALPRCGSRTTFSNPSRTSGTSGSCG